MRTTLDIDDDVLQAAKELARGSGRTAGQVLSELARRGLGARSGQEAAERAPPASFLGFRPLASRGGIVTDEIVDRIREADGD